LKPKPYGTGKAPINFGGFKFMGGGGISTVESEIIFASPMKGMNDKFSELLAHGQNSLMFLRRGFPGIGRQQGRVRFAF
jgi:hypothetical protein